MKYRNDEAMTNKEKSAAIRKISRDNGIEGWPSAKMVVEAVRGHRDHILYADIFGDGDRDKAAENWYEYKANILLCSVVYLPFEDYTIDFGSPTLVFSNANNESEPSEPTSEEGGDGDDESIMKEYLHDPEKIKGVISIGKLAERPELVQKRALDRIAKMTAGWVRRGRLYAGFLERYTPGLEQYFEDLLEDIFRPGEDNQAA